MENYRSRIEAPASPEVSRQIRSDLRKRWFYIVPAVFVTYSLAYLDRANYGLGAAAGLADTLQITNAQSALLGALFFLGYFLFQIPGTAYARKKSVTRLIFFALICWGILAALTGMLHAFWLLAIDRLLLGVAESFVFPAMLILLTHWFTRSERSRTNTLLMLGNPVTVLWMSVVTGFIINAVGWQMAFVLEGAPAVLWAFLWYWIMRDQPQDVAWLRDAATEHLQEQLDREQSVLPEIPNVARAFRHPTVILICIQYFFWSAGVYGFVLWLPTMIQKSASRSIQITGLLSSVPYMLAVVLMVVTAYFADRSLRRKRFIWPFLIAAGVALLGSFSAAGYSSSLAYCFLIVAGGAMYAPYGPFFAIIPDMLPKNVAGEVMALVNSCGALGGFFGSWLVGLLEASSGNSRGGFLFMALSFIASGLITLCLPNLPSLPETTPDESMHTLQEPFY